MAHWIWLVCLPIKLIIQFVATPKPVALARIASDTISVGYSQEQPIQPKPKKEKNRKKKAMDADAHTSCLASVLAISLWESSAAIKINETACPAAPVINILRRPSRSTKTRASAVKNRYCTELQAVRSLAVSLSRLTDSINSVGK